MGEFGSLPKTARRSFCVEVEGLGGGFFGEFPVGFFENGVKGVRVDGFF